MFKSLPKIDTQTLARAWMIAVALVLLVAGAEMFGNLLSRSVARVWSGRSKLPTTGAVGPPTWKPVFYTAQHWMNKAGPSPIVVMGDSVFLNPTGTSWGELPLKEDFAHQLRSQSGRDVVNMAGWSYDWPLIALTLQPFLPGGALHRPDAELVIGISLSYFDHHPYDVIFAQLCHQPECQGDCRSLCDAEPRHKEGAFWTIQKRLPPLADALAGIASFSQVFLGCGPLAEQNPAMRKLIGLKRLWPEALLTPYLDQSMLMYTDFMRRPEQLRRHMFKKAGGFIARNLRDQTLTQERWDWLEFLAHSIAKWPGKKIIVGHTPNPIVRDFVGPSSAQRSEELYAFAKSRIQAIAPDAIWIDSSKHLTQAENFVDPVHWDVSGTRKMAQVVSTALKKQGERR